MKWMKRKVNRSVWGDLMVFLVLCAVGVFMIFPLIMVICNAFKPLDEIFHFPPKVFVSNPTMTNFEDLFNLMMKSEVPFTRYIFNSLFITTAGTIGAILISTMCAYSLAKLPVKGSRTIFNIVVITLMFTKDVTLLPNYLLFSKLNLVDSYASLIIPAMASSVGLFLVKQYIEANVPDAILEAARIDGAGELRIWAQIIMPMIKPAWLTMIIFCIQALWAETGNLFIYSEELKTLPYALSQILAGGISRTGPAAAATVFTMIVPIGTFFFTQSNIIETMTTSGMKD